VEFILFLQSFASPFLDTLMYWITQLGSEQAYIVLLVILFLAIDAPIGRRLGLFLLLSLFINQHLKIFMNTTRPFLLDQSLLRSPEAGITAEGGGFPSGHAQSSMTLWGLIGFYFRKPWVWILSGLVILLISLSRLYLGVHWVVDVVGGLVIGVAMIGFALVADPLFSRALKLPYTLIFILGLGIPLALHYFFPTPESELLMGAFAAYATAPMLFKHHPPKTLWKKIVLALLGIILVFAFLLGSSALLPENIKRDPIGGFVRYLLLGYIGLLVAPWLGRLLHLNKERGKGKVKSNE
jgi:membrane-associated phospholipid phosphatase